MKQRRRGNKDFSRLIELHLHPVDLRGRGKSSCLIALALLLVAGQAIRAQSHDSIPPEKRLKYQINLKLDFESRTYTGSERVHWINRGDHATSVLYFHLYSNLRSDL